MIKRPEATQQIIISGGILGDLGFLLNLVCFFQIFYSKSVWFIISKKITEHVVKICLSALYTASKKTLAFQNLQAKVAYIRVEFANYHNVQTDFEFSSSSHCVACMAAVASAGIWAPARPICHSGAAWLTQIYSIPFFNLATFCLFSLWWLEFSTSTPYFVYRFVVFFCSILWRRRNQQWELCLVKMQCLSFGVWGMPCCSVLSLQHLQAVSILLISRSLHGRFFSKSFSVPFLLISPPREIWKWSQIEIINVSLEQCSLVFGTFFYPKAHVFGVFITTAEAWGVRLPLCPKHPVLMRFSCELVCISKNTGVVCQIARNVLKWNFRTVSPLREFFLTGFVGTG